MMFVETVPGGVLVDVLADGATTTFDARIPFCTWGFAAALTLGRWEVEGAEIEVDLLETKGAHRARMSDDDHLMVLDLRSPATVSHDAGGRAAAGAGDRAPLETAGN